MKTILYYKVTFNAWSHREITLSVQKIRYFFVGHPVPALIMSDANALANEALIFPLSPVLFFINNVILL